MPPAVHVQLGAALSARPAAAADTAELRRLLTRAASATLMQQDVAEAEVSVTLMDDAEIADMNRRFLQHDDPTDVVSFALFEPGEVPVGDVYLGYDQALRQAPLNGASPAEELVRLTVHGVLHVLGHDHPDGEERLESAMWSLQEAIVAEVFAG
jgi:probable rRNA maturation factor